MKVLTADGDQIDKPLPGAGQPNPLCADAKLQATPTRRKTRASVGTLITFGSFRAIDLGDLTWNKEHEPRLPQQQDWRGRSVHRHASRQ